MSAKGARPQGQKSDERLLTFATYRDLESSLGDWTPVPLSIERTLRLGALLIEGFGELGWIIDDLAELDGARAANLLNKLADKPDTLYKLFGFVVDRSPEWVQANFKPVLAIKALIEFAKREDLGEVFASVMSLTSLMNETRED